MANSGDVVQGSTKQVSGLTFKAFLTGAIFSFLLSVGAPYGNMVIRGSYMALDFSTPGALFLFFVLVGFVNVLLGAAHRRLALNRAELITVYIMLIVSSAIPTMGLSEYLLPIVAAPFYYATPDNEWAQLIQPHIRSWLVPQGPDVAKHFYEGLPKGAPVPWAAWARPLLCWGAFLLVFYFVMMCVMVILRKQWVERERLIYPLVHVPLEMVREDSRGSLIRPFFRNPVMWIGFIIPLTVSSLNGLHAYFHYVPNINIATDIPVFRNTMTFPLRLSFPIIGFTYFINLDIAFALWFFSILAQIQTGIFNITGIASTENIGIYGVSGSPIVAHQGTGAMLVLVLFGLWTSRAHLRGVLRTALGRHGGEDDSREMLPYRVAVLGLICGFLFMSAWLWMSGIPFLITLLFLVVAFLLFTGLTRVVSEGGLAEGIVPVIASSFIISGVGTSVLGSTGLTALGFTYVFMADVRTFVMASCANGLRLAEELGGKRRRLFWAMTLAVVVSLAASLWIILKLSYTYGGINLNQWFFTGGAVAPFNFVEYKIRNPSPVHWGGWLSTGIGAGVMVLLMLARQHFLWWPLHPLGFAVFGIGWVANVWLDVYLAWMIKSLVVRYGGPKLYHNTRPFFLGLILGQFVIAGLWLVIDGFTGMTDNVVFWI